MIIALIGAHTVHSAHAEQPLSTALARQIVRAYIWAPTFYGWSQHACGPFAFPTYRELRTSRVLCDRVRRLVVMLAVCPLAMCRWCGMVGSMWRRNWSMCALATRLPLMILLTHDRGLERTT